MLVLGEMGDFIRNEDPKKWQNLNALYKGE